MIPVYNYQKPNQFDDVHQNGCNYSAYNREYKFNREDSYIEDSPYYKQVLAKPLASAFNYSEEAVKKLSFV